MGVTTGLGTAKHRKCVNCPGQFLMQWPKFRHSVCSALGREDAQLREQDAALYDDPAATCPMGYWDGLTPVDLAAERAAQREAAIVRETAAMKRMIDILSPDETRATDIQPKIEQLATAGIIRNPETAAALETHVETRTVEIES